jgi:hypothetical protein
VWRLLQAKKGKSKRKGESVGRQKDGIPGTERLKVRSSTVVFLSPSIIALRLSS